MSELPDNRSSYEKVILYLGTEDPIDGSRSLVVPLGFMAGVGAGVGAYNGVKELVFPLNDQYENMQAQIREAQLKTDSLSIAADALVEEDAAEASLEAQDLALQYAELVEQKKDALPDGYNPHIEGAFSVASAFVTFALVGVGFVRYVTRKASDIRSRV
jgi:hypothetical protein